MSALCHQYSKAERCHHTCFLHEKATSGRLIAGLPYKGPGCAHTLLPLCPVPAGTHACMHAQIPDEAESHTVWHRLDIYLPPLLEIIVQILNHKCKSQAGQHIW